MKRSTYSTLFFILLLAGVFMVIISCGDNSTSEFPTFYGVTLKASPAEGGSVRPATDDYVKGSRLDIKATPSKGWRFVGWRGDFTGKSPSATIRVNSDMTIIGLFKKRSYKLTVEVKGQGSVSEKVIGKDGTYAEGSVVELMAIPDKGWRFDHWEGDLEGSKNPEKVAITEVKTITAVFEKKSYPLTINVEGQGTVSEQVIQADATDYPYQTAVRLMAEPATGWRFDHWEGALSGNSNPETVTVTEAKIVTAVFATLNQAPVADDQSITTDEDTAVNITLTATDAEGDALTYAIDSAPAHGTVSGLNTSTGAVTYNPDANYNGSDSFTFTVSDGTQTSAATVTITVNPVADAPSIETFSTDRNNVEYGQPVTFSWSISNPDGVTLSCTLDINADGTIDYSMNLCSHTGSQFWLFRNRNESYTPELTIIGPGGSDTKALSAAINVTKKLTGAGLVAAGINHGVGVKDDGTVVTWGSGTGATDVPTGLDHVIAVEAGKYFSVALKDNGTVVAWGDNSYGQTTLPTGLTNVVGLSTTYLHALALKSDGTVAGWGDDRYSQDTPPPGLKNVVDIAAGGFHSLALKTDGTVVGWGFGGFGSEGPPPGGPYNLTAISAGTQWSMGLKADGTVIVWGRDNHGVKSTIPAGLTNVVAIAAGSIHALALKADGTVVAWGDNRAGESLPPAGLTNVVTVSANRLVSLAVKADGTVVCWGDCGGFPASGVDLGSL